MPRVLRATRPPRQKRLPVPQRNRIGLFVRLGAGGLVLIVLVVLHTFSAGGCSSNSPSGRKAGPADVPKPLPAQLRAAWEEVGFSCGWMSPRVSLFSQHGFEEERLFDEFRSGTDGAHPGHLPAFVSRHSLGDAGAIDRLLTPERGFGLDFEPGIVVRTGATDSRLKQLTKLEQLQMLDLFANPVTDSGLKELAGLNQLQWLDLRATQVTDAGLRQLAGLKQLQGLSIGGLRRHGDVAFAEWLTDEGLKHLAALKQLQWLNLSATQVTDMGLKELAGLKQLRTLSLSATKKRKRGRESFS